MKKHIYFDKYKGDFWPSIDELKPYFIADKGQQWFNSGGNDTAGLDLIGVDGTGSKPFGKGRKDIGPTADVYSLGVLLYELLTGTTPLEAGRLRGVGRSEVVLMIRQEEAPAPSRRLSGSAQRQSVAAARRGRRT